MSLPPVLIILRARLIGFVLGLILGLSPLAASGEVLGRLPIDTRGHFGISGNGRFVLAAEEFPGLICSGGTGPGIIMNLFVYDLVTSQSDCVTVDTAGIARGGETHGAAISADGQLVVFSSTARGLDPVCDPPSRWILRAGR